MSSRLAPLDPAEQRRHNVRNALHTWILILGSGGLMAFIAWSVYGENGLLWAGILTVLGLWSASRVSPAFVLKLYNARPLRPSELPEVRGLVEEIARRAGLPAVPELHYVPSHMMNAFAVGSRHEAAIALTDGIIRGLTLRQLAGVLAHEMSHVRNGDLRVMALSDVLTRLTSVMSTIGLFGLAISLPAIMAAGMDVPWLAVLLLIFAPTIGGLMQLALSRAREYDADLDAAGLTGDPEGLASALATLERKQGSLWEGLFLPGSRLPDPSLLRSHPKNSDRIARLLSLRGEARPAISLPADRASAPSTVPRIPAPHIRWGRLGLWY
jgi:heat shock protein HtpX